MKSILLGEIKNDSKTLKEDIIKAISHIASISFISQTKRFSAKVEKTVWHASDNLGWSREEDLELIREAVENVFVLEGSDIPKVIQKVTHYLGISLPFIRTLSLVAGKEKDMTVFTVEVEPCYKTCLCGEIKEIYYEDDKTKRICNECHTSVVKRDEKATRNDLFSSCYPNAKPLRKFNKF